MSKQPLKERVADDMLPDLPVPVEGRIPSPEEMEHKARNGRYYLEDVWVIQREFPTAGEYTCHTDLPRLVNALYAQVRDIGYELVDSSDRLNDCHHALELTMAWAQVVRDARTTDTMHILRRTPENSGAMLMMQRQEHLRGQCTEWAPVSYIALVRDQQLVVTRDRVMDQAATERTLLQWARPPTPAPAIEEISVEGEAGEVVEAELAGPGNMPAALFKQQMQGIQAMLDAMSVGPDPDADVAALQHPSDIPKEEEGPVEVKAVE